MLINCNGLFSFNKILEQDKCPNQIDNVLNTVYDLNENKPYSTKKSILGETLYYWNEIFINKVLESFSSTIVQRFSEEEKELFDRYASFLIYGSNNVIDEDVQKLDEYIGTLGIIGVNI